MRSGKEQKLRLERYRVKEPKGQGIYYLNEDIKVSKKK